MAREFVDDTTTKKRIARDKEKILNELENNPIPSVAVRKVGISHSTYYRWIKEDSNFEHKARQAIDIGRSRFNDLAISQLIKKVQESDMRAIEYWLRHNDERYRSGITLTETQAREILTSRDYAHEVLSGNIPTKIGRFLNSWFRLDLIRRRVDIAQKALGGGSI